MVRGPIRLVTSLGRSARYMDNFPGPSDALFDQDFSRLECLDSFDPFWQEDDQVGSVWLNPTESCRDGEQHQAIEEEERRRSSRMTMAVTQSGRGKAYVTPSSGRRW